jgi:hypothetical protein
MVPVQSEQCSPPILARILFRSGRVDGSSLHKGGAESIAVDVFIRSPHNPDKPEPKNDNIVKTIIYATIGKILDTGYLMLDK